MSEKNLEPFKEFTAARKQFDKELMRLISEFEHKYNCRVTEIRVPDHEWISDIEDPRWVPSSYLRTTVEF